MSIKALNWAFEHERTFQSSQRFVLVALANFSSETGKAYPQVATICRLTGLKDDTVRSALKALVDEGIIVDTGKRAGPTQQVKVYQLPAEACELKTPENGGLQAGRPAKPPENGGLSKTPMKPADLNGSPLGRPGEDPAKTPENGGQSLTITKNQNGAGAPAAKEPAAKRQLTDAFVAGWSKRFGGPYKFNGAADGKAADDLLKLGLSVDYIMRVAADAWDNVEGFNSKHAMTLRGLAGRFNEIRAEVGALKRPAAKKQFVRANQNL